MCEILVQDLLASLKNTYSYTGEDGLDRPIRTVSFIDTPTAIPRLKGGEVILTTAFLYKDSPEQFKEFVQQLIDRNVAALGLKVGRHIDHVPNSIIQLAKKNSFCIFKIDYHTVWSEIFNAYYQLKNMQEERTYDYKRFFISFDKLFHITAPDLQALHTHFLSCFTLPSFITNHHGEISVSNPLVTSNILKHWALFQEKRATSADGFAENGWFYEITLNPAERLVLYLNENTPVPFKSEKEWIRLTYETFRKRSLPPSNDYFTRQCFIKECIINGEQSVLADYCRILNIKKESASCVLIFQTIESVEAFQSALRSVSNYKQTLFYYAKASGHIIVFYNKPSYPNLSLFTNELRGLLMKTSLLCPDSHIEAGLPVAQVTSLTNSYRTALHTLELRSLLYPEESILFYQDICVLDLLANTDFSYDELEALEQQLPSLNAIETLDLYLNSANIRQAAEQGHIHANSLRYRLDKIEKFLHLDLNKSLHRMNLLLKINLMKKHRANL